MPNQSDILKAKERRERRKLAREAAVEQAHAQDQKLSETIAANKDKPKPAAVKPSTKEIRAAEREAAEKEANRQEREMVVRDEVIRPVQYAHRQPTLHELNQFARQQLLPIRKGARNVARAAGKAAYTAAMSGEAPHLGPSKHQRMFDAQDALAKAKAAKTDKSE